MIPGQESIPVGQSEPVAHPCAWCGKPAHDHIEIAPARWRNHNGVRVEAKAALTAPACKAHYRSIVRIEKEKP